MKTKEKEVQKVLQVMFRSNPQLGLYCNIVEAQVVKTNKKTMVVSTGYSERKFDFFGDEVNPKGAIYGSTTYKVFSYEAAKELFDGEKFNGIRISQGKEILQNMNV